MEKLKLDLEAVEVQSFETISEEADAQGTVHAAQFTRTLCDITCGRPSCCHTAPEIVV